MTLEEAKKILMEEEGFRKAYEELEEEYENVKARLEDNMLYRLCCAEASTEGEEKENDNISARFHKTEKNEKPSDYGRT